jgi:hypothetical protein
MNQGIAASLRHALRWSGREWLEVLEAHGRLLGAWRAVRRTPRGELLAYGVSGPGPAGPLAPAQRDLAERLARAIRRAADQGLLRVTCLPRSLALQRWLEGRGIPGARVHLGVRGLGGRFEAHAWVTVGDELIGDRPEHVATFTPLTDATGVEA